MSSHFCVLGFYNGKSAKNEPKIRNFQNLPKTRPKMIFIYFIHSKVVSVFGFGHPKSHFFAPKITENGRCRDNNLAQKPEK